MTVVLGKDVYTCDLCGLVESVLPNNIPAGWHRVGVLDPARENWGVDRHLCQACVNAVRKELDRA